MQAASIGVADQYLHAFGKLAKEGNTILLPSNTSDPASMIAQAMSIYGNISNNKLMTNKDMIDGDDKSQ